MELDVDEVDEEDDDSDNNIDVGGQEDEVEAVLCFLSLSNSFHRTVHFGGLGEGSSSMNHSGFASMLPRSRSSSSFPSPSSFPCLDSIFRPTFSNFSSHNCSVSHNLGNSFPSRNSSSALNMESRLTFVDRNSNSAVLQDFLRSKTPSSSPLSSSSSASTSISRDLGSIETTPLLSSRNSAEKEILGLEEAASTAVTGLGWIVSTVTMEDSGNVKMLPGLDLTTDDKGEEEEEEEEEMAHIRWRNRVTFSLLPFLRQCLVVVVFANSFVRMS